VAYEIDGCLQIFARVRTYPQSAQFVQMDSNVRCKEYARYDQNKGSSPGKGCTTRSNANRKEASIIGRLVRVEERSSVRSRR
jgi:hypothetical protein